MIFLFTTQRYNRVSSQDNLFEYPLNERIRKFLRLEYLFDKINYFLPQPEELAGRIAVETLLEILNIAREEVDSEILQELERCVRLLEAFAQQTEIDSSALQRFLDDLNVAVEKLRALDGSAAQPLRDNIFLRSILQRSLMPGGTCSFDLPHYTYWLRQEHIERRNAIETWLEDALPIRDGIHLFLSLLRGSCDPQPVTATAGFYHYSAATTNRHIQMLRIHIDPALALFPEVSGHKQRFYIRFMEARHNELPIQTTEDITFALTCCVF